MLYTTQSALARVRSEDGRRVFYLTPGDRLTPSAREALEHEHIEIRSTKSDQPAEFQTLFGAVLTHKPEHMTALQGNVLVFKDHPRIALRGQIDALQAEVLLLQQSACSLPALATELGELLTFLRTFLRCEVLSETLDFPLLGSMNEAVLRDRSHHPERYYNQSHFMPEASDSALLLQLNRLRTLVRKAEIAVYRAFRSPEGSCAREDLLQGMNRASSFVYLMMIRLKAGSYERS